MLPFLGHPTGSPKEELPALRSNLLPYRHILILLLIFIVPDALELVLFRRDIKEGSHEEYDHQQVEITRIQDYKHLFEVRHRLIVDHRCLTASFTDWRISERVLDCVCERAQDRDIC